MESRFAAKGNGDVESFVGFQAAKSFRSDADDFKGMAVELDGFAENVGRAAVMILPESVADDGDGAVLAAVVQIIFAIEDAAAFGRNAEDVEEIAADPEAVDDALFALLREVEATRAIGEGAGETVLMIANGFPQRNGEMIVAADGEADQAMRIGHGKRTKHERVDDAEDRGVGADAERERKNSGDGEAARGHKIAPAVAKILRDRIEPTPAPGVAAFFAKARDVAELFARGAGVAHFGGAHFDVQAHLFGE